MLFLRYGLGKFRVLNLEFRHIDWWQVPEVCVGILGMHTDP